MRRFRNTLTNEIVDEETLFEKEEFKKQIEINFADDSLFDDWLSIQGFSRVELFNMDFMRKEKLRQQFWLECKEYSTIDLDFEEIFD